MRICVISDTHGKWSKLTIPDCDLLISCGDYSFKGETHMVREFHQWLDKQPAKHVISVQGNHETAVEKNFSLNKQLAQEQCPRVHFIDEGLVEIEGLKIWCSAITPFFHDWAWNRFRGEDIKRHWDKIPLDIDLLITHGPPHGILDTVSTHRPVAHLGCEDLYNKIQELPNLKGSFFGHIHDSYGSIKIGNVTYINASICNEEYKPVNKPIIFNT